MKWITSMLFTLAFTIHPSETKRDVFCKPRKHEQYIEQFKGCKKCDRCPAGWGYGLDGSQNEVEMDPVHGATSCQKCIKCVNGVTFSKYINHRPCRLCKNCTAIGKVEVRPCTLIVNAKCGEIPPPSKSNLYSRDEKAYTRQKEQKERDPYQSTATKDLVNFRSVFLWTTIVLTLIVGLFVMMLYVMRRNARKRIRAVNKLEEVTPKTNGGEDNEITIETTTLMTEDNREQHSEELRNFIRQVSKTDSVPYLESNFTYELDTIPSVEKDMECDGNRLHSFKPADSHLQHLQAYLQYTYCNFYVSESELKSEMLTDAQLQDLCPELAASNNYRRVGRMLGVRDNDIEIINEQNRGDPKESAFQTLKKWRELKGKQATKQRLREALCSTDRQDLADRIK
ncbi:uncharacterized protein LOC133173924 [Saccostrea echinata]|uniref:uncharacterized protein LOC133173924 n=1 Tax=Saccostrea echinata TaxID=191078 RepID=UPI002A80454B|nr:uncharacterized protein LOC133173924 [Saccostrea echinata]